ncbi:hypothetical protein X975_26847, partial [Stegodyphus mimosarum]
MPLFKHISKITVYLSKTFCCSICWIFISTIMTVIMGISNFSVFYNHIFLKPVFIIFCTVYKFIPNLYIVSVNEELGKYRHCLRNEILDRKFLSFIRVRQ